MDNRRIPATSRGPTLFNTSDLRLRWNLSQIPLVTWYLGFFNCHVTAVWSSVDPDLMSHWLQQVVLFEDQQLIGNAQYKDLHSLNVEHTRKIQGPKILGRPRPLGSQKTLASRHRKLLTVHFCLESNLRLRPEAYCAACQASVRHKDWIHSFKYIWSNSVLAIIPLMSIRCFSDRPSTKYWSFLIITSSGAATHASIVVRICKRRRRKNSATEWGFYLQNIILKIKFWPASNVL